MLTFRPAWQGGEITTAASLQSSPDRKHGFHSAHLRRSCGFFYGLACYPDRGVVDIPSGNASLPGCEPETTNLDSNIGSLQHLRPAGVEL